MTNTIFSSIRREGWDDYHLDNYDDDHRSTSVVKKLCLPIQNDVGKISCCSMPLYWPLVKEKIEDKAL